MKTDFETGICVGMLLGNNIGSSTAVIKPLQISKNGVYNAPTGVDGYSPVTVSVADRYTEGYQQGYTDGESAVKAKIQSKTITANGTYSAAADGLDGFDPVVVNVSGIPINGTIYNPNDTDKNYPLDNPTITNPDDINDIIGDTVISAGDEITIAGIDSSADCVLRIYTVQNGTLYKICVETVNLLTGKTDKSYSGYGFNPKTTTATITGIKFTKISGKTTQALVSYSYSSGYSGGISQQPANAGGTSYGTAVAVSV